MADSSGDMPGRGPSLPGGPDPGWAAPDDYSPPPAAPLPRAPYVPGRPYAPGPPRAPGPPAGYAPPPSYRPAPPYVPAPPHAPSPPYAPAPPYAPSPANRTAPYRAGGWASPDRIGVPGRRPRPLAWVAVAFALALVLVAGIGVAAFFGGAVGPDAGRGASAAPAGAQPGPAAIAGDADPRVAGIRASLRAMTDGVRTHDSAAFLSAFPSGSDARQKGVRARATARFAALSVLPLQDPEFTWSGEFPESEPDDPAEPVTIVAEFSYRLRGWDTLTAHDPLTFRFGPLGGRWVVIDDTASAGNRLPVGPYAEPWSTGRLVVEQRPHVLVLGDAGRRADVRVLATNLERVVVDVRRVWPVPSWNGKVVAYAATDRRFVNEWFGDQAADGRRDQPDGQPSFEARVVSLPGPLRDGEPDRGPTRLVVTPYLLTQRDAYSVSVLRHEVTHVATDHIGRYPPAWLLEGAAEYTGFRLGGSKVDALRTFAGHGVPPATAQAMRRGTWRPVLVNEAGKFYRGTSRSVENAYTDGWLASLYVADRYGDATLRRLYEVACAQPENAAEPDVEAVALRTVLHTDHAAFTSAVRTYGIKLRKRFP